MVDIVMDMSDAFDGLIQPVILRTVTTTTVDFVPTDSTVDEPIQAVCQRPELDKLQIEQIDYDLEYITAHSITAMVVGQFIIWNDKTYKIVSGKEYPDYNYYKVIAEEVKA